MYIIMEKLQRGPALKLIFSIVNTPGLTEGATSDVINVDDSALIKFKFIPSYDSLILLPSFTVRSMSNNPLLKMKMTVKRDDYYIEMTCTDDFENYRAIGSKLFDVYVDPENRVVYSCVLVVTVEVRTISVATDTVNLSQFHNFRKNARFHLRTADGSVDVHGSLLVPHSEIFQAIHTDNSETEWQFSNPGVTINTLQNLKEYIYFDTLPDEGLQELLMAATDCLMERLKTDCILKLVNRASAENLDGLIEFAIKNNIPELVRAMLLRTPDSVVNRAYDMREKNREISYENVEQSSYRQK